jgi:hypothetical protein
MWITSAKARRQRLVPFTTMRDFNAFVVCLSDAELARPSSAFVPLSLSEESMVQAMPLFRTRVFMKRVNPGFHLSQLLIHV